jgi:hypothetical protein
LSTTDTGGFKITDVGSITVGVTSLALAHDAQPQSAREVLSSRKLRHAVGCTLLGIGRVAASVDTGVESGASGVFVAGGFLLAACVARAAGLATILTVADIARATLTAAALGIAALATAARAHRRGRRRTAALLV